MPNTKINVKTLKNHFYYRKWIYIIIIAVGYFVTDLAYTMTEYRPPDERKVDFQLVQSGVVDVEGMKTIADAALKECQEYDDTLEEVEFVQLQYSGDPQNDVYGVQKYVVMIAAQEGDIWILNENLFLDLYLEGAALPLDEFIDKGILNIPPEEADKFRLFEATGETTEDGAFIVPKDGQKKVYACPASLLAGIEEYGFDTQGKCAVIMSYSANPQTSAKVLDSLIRQLSEEQR